MIYFVEATPKPNKHIITEQIRRRLTTLLDKKGRRLLGITGPPGAGKSTLANELAGYLGDQAVVVPMDGFHLSNFQLAKLGRSGRKGAPDTFDIAGYLALLRRVRHPKTDEAVYAPQFQREMEESIAAVIAVPPEIPIVITEGNYLLLDRGGWEHVRALLDEVWYIDVDADERRSRLLQRHQEFGRSRQAAEEWVEQTDEPNAQLIEARRLCADFHLRAADDEDFPYDE